MTCPHHTLYSPVLYSPYFPPRVYPSHNFEKNPPCSRCSFQLARRAAILVSADSRFCELSEENRPGGEPELVLERRRSLREGVVGESELLLALVAEPAEPAEFWVGC